VILSVGLKLRLTESYKVKSTGAPHQENSGKFGWEQNEPLQIAGVGLIDAV
jgi:hypothetical protein